MILIIDNYDSFVYNLYQYIGEVVNGKEEIIVIRNDKISIAEIEELKPNKIVLSPGPCTPDESGICKAVVERFYKEIPILGVCLGHQVIGKYFGGKILRLNKPVHGKSAIVKHTGEGLFKGIPDGLKVIRYHSLIVSQEGLSEKMEVVATTIGCGEENGIIMGLKHKDYPLYGLQFHPESIETQYGMKMIENFINEN